MTQAESITEKSLLAPVEPVTPTQPLAFANLLSEKLEQDDLNSKEHSRVNTSQKKPMDVYSQTSNRPVRKKVSFAKDVMTKPVQWVSEHSSIKEAKELMRKHRVRHLPVLSQEGTLIGMLSDRDILGNLQNMTQPVSKCMSSQVHTAFPETSIQVIAETLLEKKIGALPVIDLDRKVVGILTTIDILRAIVKQAPIDLWV